MIVRRLALVACPAVLAVGVVSFLPHSNWWWGVNLLHFLPIHVRVGAPLVTLAVLTACAFWPERRAARLPAAPEANGMSAAGPPAVAPNPATGAGSRAPLLAGLAAVPLAIAVFHLLRARHVLLGDGGQILNRLTLGEPLTTRSAPYDVVMPWIIERIESFRGAGVSITRVGFPSTLVGALTVGCVTALLVARARGGRVRSSAAAAALVLLQPALQLFCGYVETYSLLAGALILLFLLLPGAAAGRAGPGPSVAAALAAFAAHPLGALSWPGLLAAGRARVLSIVPLAVLALLALLFRIPGLAAGPLRWLDPVAAIQMAYGIVAEAGVRQIPFRFLALPSFLQAADVANQLWLTAAPALLVIAALASLHGGRRALAWRGAMAVLLGTAGFVAVRVLLRTPLGASRDWDLFAGAGIGLTAFAAAALGAWLDRDPDGGITTRGAGTRLTAQLVVLGLFFTGPWLTMQAWSDAGVDRHISLLEAEPHPEPEVLIAGHTAMGDRFTRLGQSYLAAGAYREAYRVRPGFDSAWRAGVAYMACGRLEDAGGAFQECARLSPRDWRVWNEFGNALTGLNQFARADSALRRSIRLNPHAADPRIHLARSLAMQGLDRDARVMLESARPLMDPKARIARDFQKLDENLPGGVPRAGSPEP